MIIKMHLTDELIECNECGKVLDFKEPQTVLEGFNDIQPIVLCLDCAQGLVELMEDNKKLINASIQVRDEMNK